MKGKLVTMAVSFLLCVGMVGAGFASWVITNTATDSADGKIAVDTVVDKRLKLDIDEESVIDANKTDLAVYFGAPAKTDTNNTSPWLINTDYQKENLTAKVVVDLYGENLQKIANASTNKTATITLKAKLDITGNDAFELAKTYNLITIPKELEITADPITATESSLNQEVVFEFKFGWGNYFTISENDTSKIINTIIGIYLLFILVPRIFLYLYNVLYT